MTWRRRPPTSTIASSPTNAGVQEVVGAGVAGVATVGLAVESLPRVHPVAIRAKRNSPMTDAPITGANPSIVPAADEQVRPDLADSLDVDNSAVLELVHIFKPCTGRILHLYSARNAV